MNPTEHAIRPWQRQPGEAPADFTAFVAYLRLKGRRSLRVVAERTGLSLGAVRRRSRQFNWPGRVAAFEMCLADATRDAVDSVLRQTPVAMQSELEQLRIQEFLLAREVIEASKKWLELAANPRRRLVPISHWVRVAEFASRLGRHACGIPVAEASRRRKKKEPPGYWTGPSVEEALEKIYGSESAASPARSDAVP